MRPLVKNFTNVKQFYEGDDQVMCADDDDFHHKITDYLAIYDVYGIRIKLESKGDSVDEVTFCGRHFYMHDMQLHDMCDIRRALDKFHITTSNLKDLRLLLLAKSLSYYHTECSTGDATPIVGVMCYYISRILATKYTKENLAWRALRYLRDDRKSRWMVRLDDNYDPGEALSTIHKMPFPVVSSAARAHASTHQDIPYNIQVEIEAFWKEAFVVGFVPNSIPQLPSIPHSPGQNVIDDSYLLAKLMCRACSD